MKIYKLIFILLFIISVVFIIKNNENRNCIKWKDDLLIGHSFGSIGNDIYTGSYEAFYAAYSRGIRTFEVDLYMTSDNKIVLAHDFDEKNTPTEKQFLETPIQGKYTPMSFAGLLELMNNFQDIYIITDTKYVNKHDIEMEFNEMVNTAKKMELLDVFDRLIVQIYYEDMYYYVQEIYNFKSTIFTLYMRGFKDLNEFEKICLWCQENNIKSIAIWNSLYNKNIKKIAKKYDINIYIHTENDVNKAKKFIKDGVKGIYTDSISRANIISQ